MTDCSSPSARSGPPRRAGRGTPTRPRPSGSTNGTMSDGAQQRLAREVVAGEDVRAGQRDEQREHGRQRAPATAVNHSTSRRPWSREHSSSTARGRACPSGASPRPRIDATGYTKKTAKNATGTATASQGRAARRPAPASSPQHDVGPLVDPARHGWSAISAGGERQRVVRRPRAYFDEHRRQLRALDAPGTRTSAAACPPGTAATAGSRRAARRPPRCSVPSRMPANSIWRKQLPRRRRRRRASAGGSAKTTSAGGLDAYDTTSGRSPSPAAAAENSLVVRLLPAVDDRARRCRAAAPVVLPAVLAELGDGGRAGTRARATTSPGSRRRAGPCTSGSVEVVERRRRARAFSVGEVAPCRS